MCFTLQIAIIFFKELEQKTIPSTLTLKLITNPPETGKIQYKPFLRNNGNILRIGTILNHSKNQGNEEESTRRLSLWKLGQNSENPNQGVRPQARLDLHRQPVDPFKCQSLVERGLDAENLHSWNAGQQSQHLRQLQRFSFWHGRWKSRLNSYQNQLVWVTKTR